MPVTVNTNASLALSKGQHRTVFRNPRSNKTYISLFVTQGTGGQAALLKSEYSTDGVNWGNAPATLMTFDGDGSSVPGVIHAFDVKMDGNTRSGMTEVWIAAIGYDGNTGNYITQYVLCDIVDGNNNITPGFEQTIDAAINDEGISGAVYAIALARTDNGRLVVAFTEQYNTMGKDYVLTKLIGSDGDGVGPNWSGETTWDDSSGSTDNQNKADVFFALESFSSSYPDDIAAYGRQPAANTSTAYNGTSSVLTWGGSSFTIDDVLHLYTTPSSSHAKVFSLLVDEADYAHVIAWVGDDATFSAFKSASAGGTVGLTPTTITTSDVDACTLALDTNPATDQMYAFYHHSADSTNFHYRVRDVTGSFWGEQTITYAQDVTALSSWSRDVSGSIHIAGQYGTTVWYHELEIRPSQTIPMSIAQFYTEMPAMTAWDTEGGSSRHNPGVITQIAGPDTDWNDGLDLAKYLSADADVRSATSGTLSAGNRTDRLYPDDFGFTVDEVPDDATITGVEVQVRCKRSGAATCRDYNVRLYYAGSQRGSNRAFVVSMPSAFEVLTYGGQFDDWNSGLTPANIRGSSFGVVLQYENTSSFAGMSIDYIAVRIYTEAAGDTIPMGAVTLASSAQSLSLAAGQTVSMGAATLASSAQSLDLITDQIVSLETAQFYTDIPAMTAYVDQLTGSSRHNPGTIVQLPDIRRNWYDGPNYFIEHAKFLSGSFNRSARTWNMSAGQWTDILRVTDFGFTASEVPDNYTIVGIELEVRYRGGPQNTASDRNIFLSYSGGQVGNDQATLGPFSSSYAVRTYGSTSNDWGWSGKSPANIRDSTFGFEIVVRHHSGPSGVYAAIDYVIARIYTAAPITVNMDAATLASSPQTLTPTEGVGAQTVAMSAATLASSAQALAIETGAVSVPMSEATLVSSPQALTVDAVAGAQTVTMQAIALASSPQALDVIPGAVTVPMSAATLVSSAQTLSVVTGAVTIPMGAVSLVSAAQTLDVKLDVTIQLGTITLVGSAQALTIVPGSVTTVMQAVTLTSSPQALDVDVDQIVPFSAITLTSSAQALDVNVGGLILLSAVTLVSSPQVLDVDVDEDISFSAITLAGAAQPLTAVPGTVSALLSATTLASSAQALSVEVAQIVSLTATTLTSSAQPLAVIPGAISAPITAITLVSSAQTLRVETDKTVALATITLVGNAQALTVDAEGAPQTIALGAATLVLGAQSLNVAADQIIPLSVITLVSSTQNLDVDVAELVSLSAITLTGATRALAIVPGAVAVPLSAATLISSAQNLDVDVAELISLSAITLASSPQASTVIAGAATTSLSAITLASSAQSLTVEVAQIASLSAITLAGAAQSLTVIPGAISVPLTAATLASSAQSLRAEVAQIIPMTAITLASSPQALAVTAGVVTAPLSAITLIGSAQALDAVPGTVTISLSTITLASSAQVLTAIIGGVPQIIGMSTATLASSAQSVSVSLISPAAISLAVWGIDGAPAVAPTVSMSAVTLASSPQTLGVIPGAAIAPLSATTLVSSAQILTVIAVGAPQTISLSAITLVSAAQSLNVAVDEIIALSAITLVSSSQALIVYAPTTISMGATTLVSATQALSIIPGGAIVQISSVTLVSSAQALSLAAGAAIVPLSETTLVSSAQALTVSIGAVSIQMGVVTLIASPQGLVVIPGATAVVMGVVILVAVAEPVVAWAGGIFWYTEVIRRVSFVTLIVEPTSFITATVSEVSNVTRQVDRTSILDSTVSETSNVTRQVNRTSILDSELVEA